MKCGIVFCLREAELEFLLEPFDNLTGRFVLIGIVEHRQPFLIQRNVMIGLDAFDCNEQMHNQILQGNIG